MPDPRTYDWTDEQVDAAYDAWLRDDNGERDSFPAALDAAYALMPQPQPAAPDPDVVAWTPDDGPLADALAGLPDGHPVTIRGDWGEARGTIDVMRDIRIRCGENTKYWRHPYAPYGITSAEWRRPVPAWDGAICVLGHDKQGSPDEFLLRADSTYALLTGELYPLTGEHVVPWTAAEVEQQYGPITVLIDADGHHVEADYQETHHATA